MDIPRFEAFYRDKWCPVESIDWLHGHMTVRDVGGGHRGSNIDGNNPDGTLKVMRPCDILISDSISRFDQVRQVV